MTDKELIERIGLKWKVDTPHLLAEILNNKGAEILKIPINIFREILIEVAERAIQLNDPDMLTLMVRLNLVEGSRQ